MASKHVEGSCQEQHTRIYDYAHELLRANSGSTMKVKVEKMNGVSVFKRSYVNLKAYKDGFLACRPVIDLDGCFLKGYYEGELLTIVRKDPNDQMLPETYTLVEVENKDSWLWFLELLIDTERCNNMCTKQIHLLLTKGMYFISHVYVSLYITKLTYIYNQLCGVCCQPYKYLYLKLINDFVLDIYIPTLEKLSRKKIENSNVEGSNKLTVWRLEGIK